MKQLNEIKRLQQLAGINEIKITQPNFSKFLNNMMEKMESETNDKDGRFYGWYDDILPDLQNSKDIKDVAKALENFHDGNNDAWKNILKHYNGMFIYKNIEDIYNEEDDGMGWEN